jgi:hypothetical protein
MRSPSKRNLTFCAWSYDIKEGYILAGAVSVHEFLELSCFLDFEEDFLAILGFHFEVQVVSSGSVVSHVKLINRAPFTFRFYSINYEVK